MLVADGVARVLDFGLSGTRDRASGTVGTFAYMAPEVLVGQPASEASDLYSVGVISYELFAGRHPLDTTNINRLIGGILHALPDMAPLREFGALAQVIARLLEKDPSKRYASAEDCIVAFSRALGRPFPPESPAIRESFLQAARFVGRRVELGQMIAALEQAIAGQGTSWLVGGESGVGKTRLLDELRTRALVRGVLLLRGQAVREGGQAYQLWREPLRHLALTTELSDLEAGILKPIVPDIELLLQREIPTVASLDGQAGQRRLLDAMVSVFRRQRTPMMLILEDLQWAAAASGGGENLEVLNQLNRVVSSLPLLIVSSYRDDEVPALSGLIPETRVIKLERLTEGEIAQLSASMLGEAGRRSDVLALLQRETEGNAFFLVEVVRALAQEAGRLSGVGNMDLPARLFPQGIETIVRQRLDRVPPQAQALLRLAAVVGRQFDLEVLACLEELADLDEWLTVCVNAAVLEWRDRQWRFAHDKLREGLLATLDGNEEAQLHRRVAQALEQVYPRDPRQTAALAYHWGIVGDEAKERHYARLAGEHAAAQFANDEALVHLCRALELTPADKVLDRYAIRLACERVYDTQGAREAQARELAALEELIGLLADEGQAPVRRQAELALRRANYAQSTSDFQAAIDATRAAIDLAQEAGDVSIEAAAYLQWGLGLWRLADFEACRARLEQALILAHMAESRQAEADSLRILGNVCYYLGEYAQAAAYWEQSLVISQEIGDRPGGASALSNLGEGARSQGAYAKARGYYEQRLHICHEIGERYGEAIALTNLSLVAHNLGNDQAARGYSEQAIPITREIGNRSLEGYALTNLGHALGGLGRGDEATEIYQQALALRRGLGEDHLAIETLAGLALIALARGHLASAQAQVEEILGFLAANPLDGTEEPLRVYLSCYRILRAAQDPRARMVVTDAYAMLQDRAAQNSRPGVATFVFGQGGRSPGDRAGFHGGAGLTTEAWRTQGFEKTGNVWPYQVYLPLVQRNRQPSRRFRMPSRSWVNGSHHPNSNSGQARLCSW